MNSGGVGNELFSEARLRPASYWMPASGDMRARATITCARDCSMRSAAALRSRLEASASSTSLSSTGSLKSDHQRSGAGTGACATP